MAGGILGKPNAKLLKQSSAFSSEVLKNSHSDYAPQKPKGLSLAGILGLGQTVEINRPDTKNTSSEHIFSPNHLQQEQESVLHQQQQKLQQELDQLRTEIKKLIHATDNLEKDIEKVAIIPTVDPSEYQLNFFTRIRIFITNFRQNIAQADHWVNTFTAKKKKRNVFWNNVKNKKQGGEQYLFSNEHSAARSVS